MATDDSRRVIGKVISVAADRFVVELPTGTENFTVVGFDDIHYVARIGSFVMIPLQSEYVVAEIIGLRDKDAYTPGIRDAGGNLSKASSAKYLDLVPVGTLPQQRDGSFRFGVSIFPSLYANALYALDSELDRIFDVSDSVELCKDGTSTRYKALKIGSSSVFDGYDIKVRVDDFFGGHSAILGNTGSGKSCTIAAVTQSLFSKPDEFCARGATFLFLDVNGEYRQAFSCLSNTIRRRAFVLPLPGSAQPLAPNSSGEAVAHFRLPHWFMSVEEWELLLRASERTQQPILRLALGLTSLFGSDSSDLETVRNHVLATVLLAILSGDASSPTKVDRIKGLLATFSTPELNNAKVRDHLKMNFGQILGVEPLTGMLQALVVDNITLPNYCNQPFEFSVLGEAFDLALLYEEAHGNRQIRDYCSQMITRYKWIKEREEFEFLRHAPSELADVERDTSSFVDRLLGLVRVDGDTNKCAQIIVLDMNDAADEVVELAAAVVTRLIFDRVRRLDPRNGLPVNLVLEEAHRYIAERPSGYAVDAGRVFRRVAKEGRKYGLFITVSSQRPSELSKTVLSQCSNFVVHRIQNPDDLAHVRQMTPFISDSVLRRLPSLPKQHALIFGNAVNLPTTFRVSDAIPRPRSDDAAIRDLWFVAATHDYACGDPDPSFVSL